jgi:TolA-binding protein
VLVAAVALGVWYRNSQSPAAVVATATPSAPEAAPPSSTGPRRAEAPGAEAAGQWSIAKPALLLPLATAVVVRGEAEETARALAEALAPYRTDDYVEAERRLEGVVQKFPASADAWFYLGSTRLLDGDAAGARDALTEARAKGVGDRDDEAAWLLATAEARLGELAGARTKLTTLCDGTGAFKAPACDALSTLK